ncbi:MAG: ATP-binding protein [Gammaproteobacteria bacterium]
MKRRFSTKFYITFGQVSLLISVLLAALYFGFVPDKLNAILAGRAALAEAIAANGTALISENDIRRLKAVLKFTVERNRSLRSAVVRRANGDVVIEVGDHERRWKTLTDGRSTDSQTLVSIWAGKVKWGQVELRFEPLSSPGWAGIVHDERAQMILFIALVSFVVFYIYLARMLRHLDPSRAIPARVRAALDTMAEGLLVVDLKGQIALANQAFADMAGKGADDLIGRRAADFDWINDDGAPLAGDAYPWAQSLVSGRAMRNEMIYLRDNAAKLRTFLVNCSPIPIDGGKYGGALISFDDVTQLQEKEVELQKAKDQAEAANRAKSEFLANISHEIRSPMNAVLGFTDVLRRGYHKSERELKRHLDTIHSSGRHLLALINDILDLSKVESGRLEVERIRCPAHAIIQEVVRVLGVKATEKGISLSFRCEGQLPETIETDPSRLRQILTNLTGNAIKFTQAGGVELVARLNPAAEPQLVIEVRDSGIGIPPGRLDAIFDPFVQAESSTTRRFGGTGLGLTISRRFARALDGDITVRSEPGRGSAFTVTVATGPLDGIRLLEPEQIATTCEEGATPDGQTWAFSHARVLVVDDGEENRELVRIVLQQAGLEVDTAENGRVAIAKAGETAFDAILMDMQMPIMDGYTATRLLRQRGLKIPIVGLTAHAMKDAEREVMAAGCSAMVTKPIVIDVLMQTIAELFGRCREASGEMAVSSTSSPLAESTLGETAAAPIVSRLADHPRLRAVAKRFVNRLEQQLVACERAWEARDFEELAALAHWLKGTGGTVGFDAFTEPAQELELLAKARSEVRTAAVIANLRALASLVVVPGDEPSFRGIGEQKRC